MNVPRRSLGVIVLVTTDVALAVAVAFFFC